jgi:hypothetical protein
MIHYVSTIILFFSGLMMLPGSQIIPTTLAQENSITETNAANTTEINAGNTTETNAANTTETNTEVEEIQGEGTISRRGD